MKALTILLAAFGLAYACLWWSYQRFYDEFGVSPQDVGLAPTGNASDLAGSALQLGIWLLIAITIMSVLPLGAVTAFQVAEGYRRAPDSGGNRIATIWAFTIGIGLLVLTGAFYWWLVDGWTGLALFAIASLTFVVAAAINHAINFSANPALQSAHWPISISKLAVVIALGAAIVGITFIDLPTDAAQAGNCAATEVKAVPSLNLPLTHIHLPILAVRAQPATIRWLGSTPPVDFPNNENVVYLGQASGTVVIYDRSTHSAIRYPAGDLAVDVDANAPNCPGVH